MLFLNIALLLIITLYFFVKTRKSLHMLQQNLYNENNRYIKWLIKNYKTAFINYDLMGLFLIGGIFFIKDKVLLNIMYILTISLYLFCTNHLIKKTRTEQVKKPLITTSRIKRLWITLFIILLTPVVIGIVKLELLKYSIVYAILLVIGAYKLVLVALLVNYPVEKMVYNHFYQKAKKKLKMMSNLKVIGITGSYGKTSSKNILNEILSIKYIVRPTPRNFNTYNGLMITINNYLDKFDEIFIAEMGAYTRGDIKGLCDMVKPQYGILTTIGTAHLESFGSEENIVKTKFELIDSLPDDGVAVLNMDDEKQINYNFKNKVKKVWVSINKENSDYQAVNIKVDNSGCNFDLKLKNEKELYHFETKLLGGHNVYNILASIALGIEFGISIKDLIVAVRKVKPVEHRLEMKKLGPMYQIDDAYNSNPIGAKKALEVLSMMPGDKVVVTPGMTELGAKEDELNKEFGRQIGTISKADYVILVGKKKTIPILEGIKETDYDIENVIVINNVVEAYTIIQELKSQKDIYALFENDLSDTNNE